MKAIRVHEHGGVEAMRLEELPLPEPAAGQVLVEVKAAGVNLFDTQLRSGLYKRDLPQTLGGEGAGVVLALGAGVADLKIGDRVAWVFSPSYATHAIAQADRVVPLPSAVGYEEAAATLFQGLTAHYLATSTFPLAPDSSCLVHSAAGGCGILLCQMAKIRGALVIGAVSTPAKAEIARAAGADHVVVYAQEDFEAAVKRITGGRGVDVVYDAVGLDTYVRSMNSLRPRGMLALYGEASGLVPPIDPRELLFRKSLYLTRTGLDHYIASRSELMSRTGEIFTWMAQGRLQQRIFRTYRLDEVADAHRALEGRASAGKLFGDPMTAANPMPPRLPLVEAPDDPLARDQFDQLAAGRGILNLHRMMAYAPTLMKASGDMAVAFRHEAILSRALAEIVILRTAQVADCDYEWERHVPIARAAGVSERQIAEVGRWPQGAAFDPKEKIALKYAETLAGGAPVDDQTFAELQRHFPAREIVALTMLVGFYVATAIFIKALRVPDDNG